jgi:hypothetical protein
MAFYNLRKAFRRESLSLSDFSFLQTQDLLIDFNAEKNEIDEGLAAPMV